MEKMDLHKEALTKSPLSWLTSNYPSSAPIILKEAEGIDGRPMGEYASTNKERLSKTMEEYRRVLRRSENLDKAMVRLYWEKLEKYPWLLIEKAFDRWVEDSPYFPSISELLSMIRDLLEQYESQLVADEPEIPSPDTACRCLNGWVVVTVAKHGRTYSQSHPCPRCVLGRYLADRYVRKSR